MKQGANFRMRLMRREKALPPVISGTACLAILAAIFLYASPARAEEPFKLGVHPYLPAAEIHERFLPLAGHLSDVLKRQVVVEISKDYGRHIQNVAEGRVDIAFMGPASYVKLVDSHGVFPLLAVLEVGGKTSFDGVIVVGPGTGIGGLPDLKGKRFAFGDPSSTMSHLVPRYMLLQAGVDVSDLAGYAHLANHDNVALGILMGEFDAGALKDEVYRKYAPKGIRALVRTPMIAEHVFVARRGLREETAEAVRSALLSLKDTAQGRAVLKSIKADVTALVPARDEDYESLRAIVRALDARGVSP